MSISTTLTTDPLDTYIEDVVKKTSIYPSSTDDFGKCYAYNGLLGEVAEWEEKFIQFLQKGQEDNIFSFLDTPDKCYTAYHDSSPKFDLFRKVINEYGDIVWYAGAMIVEFNIQTFTLTDLVKELKHLESISSSEETLVSYFNDVYNLSNLTYERARNHKLLFANSLKKYYRDKQAISELEVRALLILTLYETLSEAFLENIPLILEVNKNKLFARKENNTLQGNGDNR